MGNNKTGPGTRITNMCKSKSIDEKEIYEKAKLLLEIYRDVCWDTAEFANQVRESMSWELEYCSHDLSSALMYLEEFAPTEQKDRFTKKIQNLFEVKWMIEIVDSAMVKVKDFPLNGDLYFDILSMNYLSSFSYTEADMLDALSIERSQFYRRKREAIKVFGLSIWGGQIEEFKKIIGETTPIQLSFADLGMEEYEKVV